MIQLSPEKEKITLYRFLVRLQSDIRIYYFLIGFQFIGIKYYHIMFEYFDLAFDRSLWIALHVYAAAKTGLQIIICWWR